MDTTVKFRCKRSGNIVAFSLENDILAMRKEVGYEEIREVVPKEQPLANMERPAIKLRPGRPRKGL